jgi:hypothetical protein
VGPRAGLNRCGKYRPHRDSIHGPSSPYQLSSPGPVLPRSLRARHQLLCSILLCSVSFNVFGSVHLCTVQCSNKLMQLLIVLISYLIIYSTCFERHPLIIRSFLYCTYSLQLSRQCHGQEATHITGGCMYSKENS